MSTGPCAWPITYADCTSEDPSVGTAAGMATEPDCDPLASMDEDQQTFFETMATEYLWRWTGRRLGLCGVSIRPCRQECFEGMSTFTGGQPGTLTGSSSPFTPTLIQGQWINLGCGRCGDNCGCWYTPTLVLPGPVQEMVEVKIDAEILDPDAYRVDNHRLLIRTDGGDWPTCQDMSADPDSDDPERSANTFAITYTRGVPVPPGGQLAAGILACEFAKAACHDDSCQLPARLQSISRQGVSMTMLDPMDDIDTGKTGIWLVDSWVASMTKIPSRSRVYSPDLPRHSPRHTTWPSRPIA